MPEGSEDDELAKFLWRRVIAERFDEGVLIPPAGASIEKGPKAAEDSSVFCSLGELLKKSR